MCAELLSLITQMLIRYKDIVQPHRGGMWYCLALGVLVMAWLVITVCLLWSVRGNPPSCSSLKCIVKSSEFFGKRKKSLLYFMTPSEWGKRQRGRIQAQGLLVTLSPSLPYGCF